MRVRMYESRVCITYLCQWRQMKRNARDTWLEQVWKLFPEKNKNWEMVVRSRTCTPPYPIGPRNCSHSLAMSFHFHSKRCTIASWPGTKWGFLLVFSPAANASAANNVAIVASIVVSLRYKMPASLIYKLSRSWFDCITTFCIQRSTLQLHFIDTSCVSIVPLFLIAAHNRARRGLLA